MIKILTKTTQVKYGVIIGVKSGALTMTLIKEPTLIDPSTYDDGYVLYLMEVKLWLQ